MRPPPNLKTSKWANKYRRLPRETTASPGRWHNEKNPLLVEPMDSFDDPLVEGTVLRKSVQVGGSELLLNAIGKTVHIDPCAMLYLMPKVEDARKFSIKRLAPMIRDTPVLRTRFVSPKSRDTGNTIEYKKFVGGDITIVGVNSPSNLASLPIRIVLSDEDDRQAASSGDEGDPWELAWARTTTFRNRKGIRVSTPTLLGSSRIIAAYENTDKRLLHIPCPHCRTLHVITRDMLTWEKREDKSPRPGTARLICPHCQTGYDNAAKNAAIATLLLPSDDPAPRARWIPTAPFNGWRGYFVWAAYSPFMTLDEIAKKIHDARTSGDPAKIQVLENTVFGEGYAGVSEKIDEKKIAGRAEKYTAAVPRRVLILTVGLDTQDDRIEAEVVGWGAGHESWSIDYRVFPGDPDIPEGQPGSPWDAVTEFLGTLYRHESGLDMRITAAAIDTQGHKTQSTYSYVNAHRSRLFAIKGKGGWDRNPVSNPTRIRFGKNKSRHIFLYTLGVDQLKNTVVGRLQIEAPESGEPCPGYCHFPLGRDATYYEQLTAERLVTTIKAGRRVTTWQKEKDSDRNEALDCRVYAWAAFLIRSPRLDRIALRQKRQIAARSQAARELDADDATLPESDAGTPDDAGTPPAQDETPDVAQDTSDNETPRSRRKRRRRDSISNRISRLRSW